MHLEYQWLIVEWLHANTESIVVNQLVASYYARLGLHRRRRHHS